MQRAGVVCWFIMCAMAGAGAGCRNREPLMGVRPEHWAQPVEAPGLEDLDFWKVNDTLYRGAQPNREEYAALRDMGIRTIVNMRMTRQHRAVIEELGMIYVPIQVQGWGMSTEVYLQFLEVMKDPARHPVYVLCHFGGDRSAAAQAIYRRVFDGWSPYEAVCEMIHGGYLFHPIWQNLVRDVYEADPRELRRRLRLDETPPREGGAAIQPRE